MERRERVWVNNVERDGTAKVLRHEPKCTYRSIEIATKLQMKLRIKQTIKRDVVRHLRVDGGGHADSLQVRHCFAHHSAQDPGCSGRQMREGRMNELVNHRGWKAVEKLVVPIREKEREQCSRR